ncbi:unnamed protein product [Pleuronectes platessa]|uniref:Uncharacterized protein n=1 Tax=Pleuronectes platessa TaxID=8262 RepID=A0A9N7V1D9_PLEPL|nr:unnamed protein product [Pleuronectes platessa]
MVNSKKQNGVAKLEASRRQLIFHLSVKLSFYLSVHLSVNLSFYLSVHLSVNLSVYLSIHLSVNLSVHLSVNLSVHLRNNPTKCFTANQQNPVQVDPDQEHLICSEEPFTPAVQVQTDQQWTTPGRRFDPERITLLTRSSADGNKSMWMI